MLEVAGKSTALVYEHFIHMMHLKEGQHLHKGSPFLNLLGSFPEPCRAILNLIPSRKSRMLWVSRSEHCSMNSEPLRALSPLTENTLDFKANSMALKEYCDKKGYPVDYYESDGGHIWRNWRVYLTQFAQKIFK